MIVPTEGEGERLDRWLAQRTGRSRAEVQRLIKAGRVRVSGRAAKPSLLLQPEDRVEMDLPPPGPSTPQPEPLPLTILYEDEEIIVVDKPAGLVTHPAPGHPRGTLVNGLLHRCRLAETGNPSRPGIVHRLDRETSGALVAAKTEEAHRNLVEQFKRGEVGKRYLALVHGIIEEEEGRIELPLGRDPIRREEVRVRAEGKSAVTEFSVLERFAEQDKTLVKARPMTGRMHQIRVHFSHIGHPVV
ncbi:MAG: RluA family pseudouridine synthase, partial [Candidatus Bipolaricaulia bacterium]